MISKYLPNKVIKRGGRLWEVLCENPLVIRKGKMMSIAKGSIPNQNPKKPDIIVWRTLPLELFQKFLSNLKKQEEEKDATV